jgi:hypothetical protein
LRIYLPHFKEHSLL